MAPSSLANTVVNESLVKLSPAQRLYVFGIILFLALRLCARNFAQVGEPSFLIPLCVASIAYLLAVREFFAAPTFPRHVVFFGLALAVGWHVLFLRMPPGPDDDVHRYVWDGRVQRLGYNPYVLIPSDPLVVGLHTPETRALNNPEVPSPYPAGAQLFFRVVTAIHESTFALKFAFVLCNVAIVLILFGLLRRSGHGEHWVLAFAWHPLLATDVAGSGHVDILGALLLLISVAALLRRRRTVAAVTLGLAVAVKFLPIVLLPLYWKRVRVRDALLAAAIVLLLYVPFLNHGHILFGSLGAYVQSFRFNDPVFATFERFTSPRIIATLAGFVGLLTAVWIRRNSTGKSADEFAWPMAASLFCAPVVYPWYLLWLLPFLRSSASWPLFVWTVSIIPTYYVWHLRRLGQQWLVPEWILLLEFGPVLFIAAQLALRRFRRSAALRYPEDQPD